MLALRLRNWERAHRWFRLHGKAFSLEGRYRSPRGVEAEYETGDPPPKSPDPIDIWDAWGVELAWRECSLRSRWTLKYHYHDKLHPQTACRLIKRFAGLWLRHQDWRAYMRDARAELSYELEAAEYGRKVMKNAMKEDLQPAM